LRLLRSLNLIEFIISTERENSMTRERRYIISLICLLSICVGISSAQNSAVTPPALDPVPVVRIPAGEFKMGDNSAGDHHPVHNVQLNSFWLDKFEVTNARYAAFCKSTGHQLPQFWGMKEFHCGPDFPDYPVVGVSWGDAAAYAQWCGKRLPTEAEWEYAARGGLSEKKFPNGDDLTPKGANYANGETKGTLPVGQFPANGYGLHDMAGNVVEWVSDYYDKDYYSSSPVSNPKGPATGRFRVIRGGGWHSGPSCNRVYYRNALPQGWLDFNVGFRCAKDVNPD
jgi:formylglycine-generating enzyme